MWAIQTLWRQNRFGPEKVFLWRGNIFWFGPRGLAGYSLAELKNISALKGTSPLARFQFESDSIFVPFQQTSLSGFTRFLNQVDAQRGAAAAPINLPNGAALVAFVNVLRSRPPSTRFAVRERLVAIITSNAIPLILTIPVAGLVAACTWAFTDYNLFGEASARNTATSYRQYLGESRNKWFRAEARDRIRGLYDHYISAYRSRASDTPGANGLLKILQFLRDSDGTRVAVQLDGRSEVMVLPHSKLHVHDVAPAFTPEKNQARSGGVANALNAALEAIFPADIVRAEVSSAVNVPTVRVRYVYRSDPDSLYFPVAQQNKAPEERDWYQGISIEWYLSLGLPTMTEPLDGMQVSSNPAPRFQSRGRDDSSVYDSMVSSALQDLVTRLKQRYF
ncbi:MAG: hypothetical protein WA190_13190 [Usitatibacter sp.]